MKYEAYKAINLKNRQWPNNQIKKAPIWCSVDLRDGNQALLKPMNLEKKVLFFKFLVNMGFKEIEIGFPSASKIEYDFTRYLIDNNLIPDDVKIQVLTQAREHLIKKTREAVNGAENVIIHLYNSTSIAQREIVFKKSKQEIIDIALQGTKWIKKYFNDFDGDMQLEYSPESYTGTELEFAKDICNAVIKEWGVKRDKKMIINLPATVELATPNIYADSIEWMANALVDRDNIIISLHAHNDRGTAIASTELGLLAGGDRVEGTLLGNGERTGNVDILTLGLNMFTQGIEPLLDFSNIDDIKETVEYVTEIQTNVRHPYIGELVYTAFSGSHQDAIKKGMDIQKKNSLWRVPYLPIDPKDIGRSYEAIIQINSQSGKGGISYILENSFGYKIPKEMEPYIASLVQQRSEEVDGVLNEKEIYQLFENHFINRTDIYNIYNLEINKKNNKTIVKASFKTPLGIKFQEGTSRGILMALVAIYESLGVSCDIIDYSEHALSKGNDAKAATYIKLQQNNKIFYGVGVDTDITRASIYALLSALNISELSYTDDSIDIFNYFGLELPIEMQPYIVSLVQERSQEADRTLNEKEVHAVFERHFINRTDIYNITNLKILKKDENITIQALFKTPLGVSTQEGTSMDALVLILEMYKKTGISCEILNSSNTVLTREGIEKRIFFIELQRDNEIFYGIGIDTDITRASIQALLSALNISELTNNGVIRSILKNNFGYKVPKEMQPYIASLVQQRSEEVDGVLNEKEIYELFESHFINRTDIYNISNLEIHKKDKSTTIQASFKTPLGMSIEEKTSRGVLMAMIEIYRDIGISCDILDYSEHALSIGNNAKAATYIKLRKDNEVFYGIGLDTDITYSSINALVSSLNISLNR